MEARRCSVCKDHKPVEVFPRLGGTRAHHRSSTCGACRVNYNRRRREVDPEHVYAIERRSKLKQQYGITPEKYDEMIASQGGGCAICGATEPGGRTKHFPVDHCHTTGAVRGLLCTKCNRGLGLFNDDAERMIRAANYLRGDLLCR